MKFDVVLAHPPYWHDSKFVFGLHVQNQLSLVDSSGCYAILIQHDLWDSKPKVFTLLDDFTHVSSVKTNLTTQGVHVWQK